MDAENTHLAVLRELFSRLFAVVAKMENKQRKDAELFIAYLTGALKEGRKLRTADHPEHVAGSRAREWVDLEGLLKSNVQLYAEWFGTPEKANKTGESINNRLLEEMELLKKAQEKNKATGERLARLQTEKAQLLEATQAPAPPV